MIDAIKNSGVNLNPFLVTTTPGAHSFGNMDPLKDSIRTAKFWNNQALKDYSPFIKGVGVVIPVSMPQIMWDNYPALTAVVWKILSGHITKIDGFSDTALEISSVQFGAEGNKYNVGIKASAHSEEYTIEIPSDFRGLPVSKWLNLYVDMVYNVYTDRSYGANLGNRVFGQENHSMRFLVIQCDPAFQHINNVALLENCMFTSSKYDNLNIALGERSADPLSISINARKAPVTASLMAKAEAYLKALNILYRGDDIALNDIAKTVKDLASTLASAALDGSKDITEDIGE